MCQLVQGWRFISYHSETVSTNISLTHIITENNQYVWFFDLCKRYLCAEKNKKALCIKECLQRHSSLHFHKTVIYMVKKWLVRVRISAINLKHKRTYSDEKS